ncbi:MAG: chemotaxis protein CheB [Gammaproteobacteria bacterium]
MNSHATEDLSAALGRRLVKAVVIGASAGGIGALRAILAGLPARFGFPVVIVLHMPDDRDSRLAEVFQQYLPMPVRQADDKEMLAPGVVYFAAPGYHLSIEREGCFSLSQEDPLHFSRPAIDILMESAADAYGRGLLGILLTGASADGAAGLAAIGRAGGLTVAQDPQEAEMPTMPAAAIALRAPDLVLRLEQVRTLLNMLEMPR